MSATILQSADAVAEKAFAAHLRGFRDPEADLASNPNEIDVRCIRSGALEGVGIHEGRQTTQRESSAVIVKCQTGGAPVLSARWANLTVEIELYTSRSADTQGTTRD